MGLPRGPEPFIEMWFGDLNQPDVGRSLLGKNSFDSLRSRLKEGESAMFVIKTGGQESFKGSGFVRGGIFDRVQVKQGADPSPSATWTPSTCTAWEAAGACHTESSIFIIRSHAFLRPIRGNSPSLGNRVDRATGHRSFAVFESKYWLPADLLEGGRPQVQEPDAPWVRIWKSQALPISLFACC